MKRPSMVILAGMVLVGLGVFPAQAQPEESIILSAGTPSSSISTFALGQQVRLSFSAAGMQPRQGDLTLELHFVDEMDRTVKKQSLKVRADANGNWTKEIAAPCEKMGFWRVFVALSNGVTTQMEGPSQRSGYITYAVVPDPSKRKLYGEKETLFGLDALFHHETNVMPWLGVRWAEEPSPIAFRTYGYAWGQMEPDHPGQFAQDRAAARAQGKPFPLNVNLTNNYFVDGERKSWKFYTFAALFVRMPKWAIISGTQQGAMASLKPEAEPHWRNYCIEVAKAYSEQNPDRKENIYQITWEPQGFKSDERLIRTYEIAYKALHWADPKAVVIGPASSGDMGTVAWLDRIMSKGLGKYLDGYSIHPYVAKTGGGPGDLTNTPEQNGMIEDLRAIKAVLRKHIGRDLPMFATELGFRDDEVRAEEILQARAHVRSSLILVGEGYRVHIPFSAYLRGYGFYYSLSGSQYWPKKAGPKPVVPAYAALTFLVDGHKSSGPIEGLGEKAWGYTYRGPEDTIKALWSERKKKISVAVGNKQVEVFDWMGNGKLVPTRSGRLEVMIGPEPIYVKMTPRPAARRAGWIPRR